MWPAVSTTAVATCVIQPSARIGVPDRDRPLEVDGHPGGDAPVVLADQRPGHHLVEDRAEDPAVDDALPAFEPTVERELGPRRPGSTWRSSPRPPRVERPAGEAVVRRELEPAGRRLDAAGVAAGPSARSPQTSRFWTLRASVLMKSLRGPTFSPMSIVKISSAGRRVLAVDPQERPRLRVHRRLPELVGVHLAEALEPLDGQVLDVELLDDLVAFLLGLGVPGDLAGAHPVERRLGDVQVAVLDDLRACAGRRRSAAGSGCGRRRRRRRS